MSDLPAEVRELVAQAVTDAVTNYCVHEMHNAKDDGPSGCCGVCDQIINRVVDAVAEVLAKDVIVLSKADAEWLCGVIHGEPDSKPVDYDRAHRLLEGDRDA